MDPKKLIEERLKLNADCRALLDANPRGLTAEQNAKFDAMSTRISEIKAILDRLALVDAEERSLSESRGRKTTSGIATDGASASVGDLAFRAWALGPNRATREMVEAAQRVGLRHEAGELETRVLSSVTSTQGQASIPNEITQAFFEALKWYGPVRNTSTVIRTATGAPLPYPTLDDTSNTGEIVDEGSGVTTTADPTFGAVTFGSFKYSSKAVIVPVELLMDSSINLPVYLGSALGTRIGRKQNADFTLGGGTTLPFGIVVQSAVGKTCSATNAFTFDEVLDLVHSVDPAYRMRPGVGFMCSDLVAAYCRKLKDSNGQYLWQMALQAGQPDRLFGFPLAINNDASSGFSTGQKLLLFGALDAYAVRDVGDPTIIRDDSIRVLNHQSVFLAFHRSDGALLNASAIKHLKLA